MAKSKRISGKDLASNQKQALIRQIKAHLRSGIFPASFEQVMDYSLSFPQTKKHLQETLAVFEKQAALINKLK